MGNHFGVDISSNNSHPIAWATLGAYLRKLGGGAQPFVVVKATQGDGYANPDFAGDVAAAKANGFALAAYLMDQGNASVASEESWYKQHAEGLPQWDDDELPEGDSDATYIAHLRQLDAQAPSAPDYLNQSQTSEGFSQGVGLWLAEYNNQPGVTRWPVLMHQYTDVLTVASVAGYFDANVFMGTDAQFAAHFANVAGAPAATDEDETPTPTAPTLGATIPHGGNMIASDSVSNGHWIVGPEGDVDALDGATYYGGLNNHPDFDPIKAGSATYVCGIVSGNPASGTAYTIGTYTPGAPVPGATYNFPRIPGGQAGSLA